MSDDSDLGSYTRRGALGLMGAGGVLAAAETLGFTQLTADRGTNIQVSTDAADTVSLKIVDSSGAIDGKTYTLPDDSIETFTITNQSGEPLSHSNDDLTITLSGSNPTGSGEILINSTTGFATSGSVTESNNVDLVIDSDFDQSGSFSLGINDTIESSTDVRDALDVSITITAEFSGTTLTFTRSITIQDQD